MPNSTKLVCSVNRYCVSFSHILIFLFLLPFSAWSQEYPLETVVQKGHLKVVSAVAVSPDGKYVLTGSDDYSIKLWNASNGREIRSFNRHTGGILSVCFSPDGKQILTSATDNTILIHDIITGKVVQRFEIEKDKLRKAVYSPDNRYVLGMSDRDIMFLWDAKTGGKTGEFKKSYEGIISPEQFSPDGNKLLIYGDYKGIIVWDITAGKEVMKLETEKPLNMAWSQDGTKIIVSSSKLYSNLFDAKTGNLIAKLKDDENVPCDGCRTQVCFSGDSKYVLTASNKAGVTLWNAGNGEKIRTFIAVDRTPLSLCISPENKYVLFGDDKGTTVWNLKSGGKTMFVDAKGYGKVVAQFSPDEKFLLSSSDNHTAAIWNPANGKKGQRFEGYSNKPGDDGLAFQETNWTEWNIIRSINLKTKIALSPDGKYFVAGKIDSVARMYELETGKIVRDFKGHSKLVYAFDFSPDGKQLVTGGGDAVVKVWDVSTGNLLLDLKGHRELVFSVKYSHDGKNIISGSWDGTFRIWDSQTGKELKYVKLDGNNSPYSIGFTPNDLYVVSADMSGGLKLYETDAGEVFRSVVGHTDVTADFCFSTDGTKMITASWDGKVKVWDLLTGMLTAKFSDHESAVYAVAANEKLIFSGSRDRSIIVRDAHTGALLTQLHGHSDAVTSLAITPDGRKLISCSVDGTVKVWNLENYSELFTYIQIDRNNWLAQNPAGYFDASPGAGNLINYVSGMEVITVGALFEKYFVPGLLKRIMQGETFEETGANLDETIKKSPKVDISVNTDDTRDISIKGDSIEWTTASLPVSVMLSDEGGGLEELRIFNNGKLVYSEPLKKADAGKEKSCNIELSGGENHITAIALNRERTESLPAEIFVYFDGVEAESDLYILSVGINAYKNPSYQLSFAINDAKEFLQSVKKGSGTIFRNVNVYFVKDGEADKAGISAAFSEIAEKAGSSDVFLFYYAGHGVMSMGREAESKFYIIPYDVTKLYGDDDMLAEKGISASELMEFSRLIKARKQMFILDACQSGGAMDEFAQRGAGREKAIAQLARSTGTYFLAASGAIQYASEASSLGHGLFTWAILEALDGKTEGEAGDMKVTANELKSYVEDRVPELTEKYRGTPQYPTGFGYGQDFPIVIVK